MVIEPLGENAFEEWQPELAQVKLESPGAPVTACPKTFALPEELDIKAIAAIVITPA